MSALWRMKMFNWIKSLFTKQDPRKADFFDVPIEKPKKRPRLYKQAVVVTKGELPKPARKASVKKAPTKKVAVKKPVTKGKTK